MKWSLTTIKATLRFEVTVVVANGVKCLIFDTASLGMESLPFKRSTLTSSSSSMIVFASALDTSSVVSLEKPPEEFAGTCWSH